MSKQQLSFESEKTHTSSSLWRGLKCAGKTAVLLAGAAAAANAWLEYNSMPLGPGFAAAYERYPSRYGDVAYAVKGQGSPLLLLHAPRIGASMAEWQQVVDALAVHHTVYALDYLGWGSSDRTRRLCSASEMLEEIQFFVEDVIGESVTVLASGQSCAIAVNAAAQTPELFEKLILVCPTEESTDVFEKVLWHGHWPPQILRGIQKTVETIASLPVVSTSLSNALTTQSVISGLANELYFDQRKVTPALVNNLYTAAHQKGLRAEVVSHLSGKLDMPWEAAWQQCEQPALIVWGRQASSDGPDSATVWLALKPGTDLEIIDQAKYLPHDEQSSRFLEVVEKWMES